VRGKHQDRIRISRRVATEKEWADFVDTRDTSSIWEKMEVVDNKQFMLKTPKSGNTLNA